MERAMIHRTRGSPLIATAVLSALLGTAVAFICRLSRSWDARIRVGKQFG
jgi:hypothetical protein